VSRGKASSSCPLTVFTLQPEKPRAPALSGYTRSLFRDDLSRCVDEIAKNLPPNRGI
jgi:hypothetical protein